MASLTKDVPILSVGGLAKKWLVPGWRVGWILVYDRHDVFKQDVREGLLNLSQVILGPNSVCQAALDDILHHTPESFYQDTIKQLEVNCLHDIILADDQNSYIHWIAQYADQFRSRI